MKKIILMILMLCLLSARSHASIFDYTIKIFYESKDTKLAKESAIKNGRLLALRAVFSKLILLNEYEKLNSLLDENIAVDFDSGFTLKTENITNKFYSATAVYSFNEKKIIKFLQDNNFDFLTTKLSKYIAVIKSTNLDQKNDWEFFWGSISPKDFLSLMIVYDYNREFINGGLNAGNLLDDLGAKEIYLIDLIKNNNLYVLKITNLINDTSKSFNGITSVVDAVSLAQLYMEDSEKKEIIDSFKGDIDNLKLKIFISNFTDWIEINKRLNSITGIQVIVVSMTTEYIEIKLSYGGNKRSLESILSEKCIIYRDVSNILSLDTKCAK